MPAILEIRWGDEPVQSHLIQDNSGSSHVFPNGKVNSALHVYANGHIQLTERDLSPTRNNSLDLGIYDTALPGPQIDNSLSERIITEPTHIQYQSGVSASIYPVSELAGLLLDIQGIEDEKPPLLDVPVSSVFQDRTQAKSIYETYKQIVGLIMGGGF
jgi:hypothetical protein